MCGIAGRYSFENKEIFKKEIDLMTNQMVERGPDDSGSFVHSNFGIGMRRLSIIDVDGGHQPLFNEDNSISLVLNGEIYNYKELRSKLISKGHIFKTNSDSEVVIHLYEEYGNKAVDYLNGMFAFALLDIKKSKIWIVRDRIGIKPLFYFRNENDFYFASDIRALRKSISTSINKDKFISFLTLGYVESEFTMWNGVKKLPPGNYIEIINNNFKIYNYWKINNFENLDIDFNTAKSELEELLYDSVKLRLRSDVPFGAFLSGGLDSSALVALASKQLNSPLNTYTVKFEGKLGKDNYYANKVQKLYKTCHKELILSHEEFVKSSDELLQIIDEPIADSAIVPAYWLSKMARKDGIKVLLNGAGGDEIFAGYSRHHFGNFGTPKWALNSLPSNIRNSIAFFWKYKNLNQSIRIKNPVYNWATGISGINPIDIKKSLNNIENFCLVEDALNSFSDLRSNRSNFSYNKMLIDIENYLPQNVLSLTDKATMAASVEGRVPLLDHRLVEYSFSLPSNLNIYGNQSKGLFKKIMENHLPNDLIYRSKEGFNPPDQIWAEKDQNDIYYDEIITNCTSTVDDFIDLNFIKKILNSKEMRMQNGTFLNALYHFNKWLRFQNQ